MPGNEKDSSISAPPTLLSATGATEDPPSFIRCNTIEGAYGSLQGERLIVDFRYSVVLDREISNDDYLLSVGPGLEIQMNDHLLPVLFEEELEDCVKEKPAPGRRSLQQSRQLVGAAIVGGISARPLDSVISDDEEGECQFCYSLLGQITLYLAERDSSRRRYLQSPGSENTNDAALVEQMVREALQKAMMEGAFNNNPPIVTVSFGENVDSTNDNNNAGGAGSDVGNGMPVDSTSNIKSVGNNDNKRSIVLLTIISFLAVAASGFLLYLLCCNNRQQQRRHGEDDEIEYVRQQSQSSSSNSSQGAASKDLGVIVRVESCQSSSKDEQSSSGTIHSSGNDSSKPPTHAPIASQSSNDTGPRYGDYEMQGEDASPLTNAQLT